MEWPTAFQNRTGVKELLQAGYRWVAFNPAYGKHVKVSPAGNQNDEMIAKRRRFQEFLAGTLGLEKRCCLVGMSWGGFYSIRYASTHPECVKAIYIDAPLLDFSTLSGFSKKGWEGLAKYYPGLSADYVGADDPMQPVHHARAEKIAKAKIPVLCIYGAADTVVPAESNCMRFAEAFVQANLRVLQILPFQVAKIDGHFEMLEKFTRSRNDRLVSAVIACQTFGSKGNAAFSHALNFLHQFNREVVNSQRRKCKINLAFRRKLKKLFGQLGQAGIIA